MRSIRVPLELTVRQMAGACAFEKKDIVLGSVNDGLPMWQASRPVPP